MIDTEPFDVLLCDLHMTETGDGLAVVSAMHNKNPDALTLVYTGYPELRQALDAILLRSDEASANPSGIPWLHEPTHEKLEGREARLATNEQRVAAILERDVFLTIIDWLDRVERDGEMTRVPLSKSVEHRAPSKTDCRTGSPFASPAKAGRESRYGIRFRRAWQTSPVTGLFDFDDSRGIPHRAGLHI